MDLRIVADSAEHFAVQGWHAQSGEEWTVTTIFAGVLLFAWLEVYSKRHYRSLAWVMTGGATLVYLWFMASFWRTGGIRFDLEIDRVRGTWTTAAVYPKENGYYEPPVTRALGDVLRVDMVASPGKGGGDVNNQRIQVTLQDGTSFQPFEGEDRGSANEYLVLDRMQKMLVRGSGENRLDRRRRRGEYVGEQTGTA